MLGSSKSPGALMASEAAEAFDVFSRAVGQSVPQVKSRTFRAIYTVARGSSDAVANVLSYDFMRELGVPMTSLPPSVFSIGRGVDLSGSMTLIVSQSGASDDLVRTAKGAQDSGSRVVGVINVSESPVEALAEVTVPVLAGEERAVPATKTVVGSIGAGLALLASMKPEYAGRLTRAAESLDNDSRYPEAQTLQAAFLRARHIYVIGRDTSYGAAHEVALKLKECCAIHAEAYSSSEVLHGPLQLATNPLMVLILDNGAEHVQDSLGSAEERFLKAGCDVWRISPRDLGLGPLVPGVAAAVLLAALYPIILETALALGFDPDAPETLSKVTKTT